MGQCLPPTRYAGLLRWAVKGPIAFVLALRAALLGGDLSPVATKDALFGAGQKCPVRAADLMPEVQGEALGKRLKEIEARWIASGFALSKADLLC